MMYRTRLLALSAALGALSTAARADAPLMLIEAAVRLSGAGRDRSVEVATVARAACGGDEVCAAWLVAHAIVESGLSREVETCAVRGPAGELGVWQRAARYAPGGICRLGLVAQAVDAASRLRWCSGHGVDLAACWGGLRVERRRELARAMGAP